VPDPAQALARARELASPEDVIFITGSLYLVGELRREWLSRKGGRQVSPWEWGNSLAWVRWWASFR